VVESLEREIRELRSLFWHPRRDPDGRAFAPLADAYRRAGRHDQAREALTDGLDRLPDYATGHLVSAWLLRDLDDPVGAEAAFRRVLELDVDNARALLGLGRLHLSAGRDEAGRELVQRALELDPLLEAEEDVPELDDVEPQDGVASHEMEVASPVAADEEAADQEADVEAASPPTADAAEESTVEPDDGGDPWPRVTRDPDTEQDGPARTGRGADEADDDVFVATPLGADGAEEAVGGHEAVGGPEVRDGRQEPASGDAGSDPTPTPAAEPGDAETVADDLEFISLEPVAALDALPPGGGSEVDEDDGDDDEAPLPLDALAPDADAPPEVEAPADDEEVVASLAALAPDVDIVAESDGTEDDGPEVLSLDALAPDADASFPEAPPEEAADEPVLSLAALAPDAGDDDGVASLDSLAPEDAGTDEAVVSLDALAPDGEAGPDEGGDDEPVLSLDALAPDADPDEVVASLDSLAPEDDEAEESFMSLDALAPADTDGSDVAVPSAEVGEREGGAPDAVAADAVEPDAVETDSPAPDAPTAPASAGGGGPLPTRTLAELYARQGLVDEALGVYRILMENAPGDTSLQARAAELQAELDAGDGARTVDEAADAGAAVDRTPESGASPGPVEGGDDGPDPDEAHLPSAPEPSPEDPTPFGWAGGAAPDDDDDGHAEREVPVTEYFTNLLGWRGSTEDPSESGG
jgi:hypothetical protein